MKGAFPSKNERKAPFVVVNAGAHREN
jgi:hypothetical protein